MSQYQLVHSKFGDIGFLVLLGILPSPFVIFSLLSDHNESFQYVVILLIFLLILALFMIFSTKIIVYSEKVELKSLGFTLKYEIADIQKVYIRDIFGESFFAYNLGFISKDSKLRGFPSTFFGNYYQLNHSIIKQIIKLNPEVQIDQRIMKRYKISQKN